LAIAAPGLDVYLLLRLKVLRLKLLKLKLLRLKLLRRKMLRLILLIFGILNLPGAKVG